MRGLDAAALFAPLIHYKAVGVAVSGGPDSLALLLLIHEWAAAAAKPPAIFVYTVDHGLRPEAASEAAFVVATAGRLGFPSRALRWEGEKPATGIQQAARLARYALIAGAMAADGAEVLVTAHHQGDQAETVLMRLAHGSGIAGLRGMDELADVGGLRILRPLLGVDPLDLHAVVRAAGLTPVSDPSNLDLDYERVRWRAIMPQLAELGLDAARLAQFAARMRDADAALDAASAEAFSGLGVDGGGISIPRSLLLNLPRAIAIRLLQRALSEVGGAQKPHALSAVETLVGRLVAEPELRNTLHGCAVVSDDSAIHIAAEPVKGARARRGKLLKT